MLDKIDYQLLTLLQRDVSLSLQSLANTVNLTSTPCWKRLKRLEEEGYIKRKVAILDGEKLGLKLTAFVQVKTQDHRDDWHSGFIELVEEMPEVMSFYRMAGDYDYLIRVQVFNMKSYDDFYRSLVNRIESISDINTTFAMETIKHGTELPLTAPPAK